MILKDFTYCKPFMLAEAWQYLSPQAGRSCVLAGGTDLLIRLKQGTVSPDFLVDIKGLGLGALVFNSVEGLTVGAAVTLNDICENIDVTRWYPALYEAVAHMASYQIRNRATVGGNLCNAAPSADTAPPLIIYGATAVIEGAREAGSATKGNRQITREIPVEKFIIGPGKTVLLPTEILTEIRVPLPPAGSGSAYIKLRRTEKDIALVGVAVQIRVSKQGICTEIRIALGAVAPTPIRAKSAERVMQGQLVTDDLIYRAAAAAVSDASPIDDVRATAAYRRDMINELTVNAVKKAMVRSRTQ